MRKDKEINQTLIRDALLKYVDEFGKAPSNLELSRRIGVSNKTVERHLKEIKFDKVVSVYRVLTPDVIMNIYEATKKHTASQKLWLQLFEGFSDVQKMDLTVIDKKKAIEDLEAQFE